jgi:hypothetical protein
MPPAKKKIEMPDDIYGNEAPGAIEKLTGGGGNQPKPPTQPESPPEKTKPTRNLKPTSIYLTPDQLQKLDDLAYTYNRRNSKRIDRQDIIRHLVNTCDIGNLQGL